MKNLDLGAVKLKCVKRGIEFSKNKNIMQHLTWRADINKQYDLLRPTSHERVVGVRPKQTPL